MARRLAVLVAFGLALAGCAAGERDPVAADPPGTQYLSYLGSTYTILRVADEPTPDLGADLIVLPDGGRAVPPDAPFVTTGPAIRVGNAASRQTATDVLATFCERRGMRIAPGWRDVTVRFDDATAEHVFYMDCQAMHLAELNIGRLVAPPGDPRVAEFMAALAQVNGLGKRMPGFVWMMEDSADAATGNTGTAIGGDPCHVTNLTVWTDLPSLETFVFKTLHKRFFERRAEWFEIMGQSRFVMWHVPEGHRPTLEEGLERIRMHESQGDGPEAFGWDWARARRAAGG